MCMGEEDNRGKSNRREIKPLARLGYKVDGVVPGHHPLYRISMTFFEIRDHFNKIIAMLAASLEDGVLIVSQIYTNRDSRSSKKRPLASDILLSFWKHEAGQDVRDLRGVLFQTVEEPGVNDAKAHVYRNLEKQLSEAVVLERNSRHPNERREFHRVHDDTKLGRCVRTMAKEYIEMKEYRFEVSGIQFIPQGRRGFNFHMMVWLHQARSGSA